MTAVEMEKLIDKPTHQAQGGQQTGVGKNTQKKD